MAEGGAGKHRREMESTMKCEGGGQHKFHDMKLVREGKVSGEYAGAKAAVEAKYEAGAVVCLVCAQVKKF